VADADGAVKRRLAQAAFQVAKLALGAAARQRAAFERRDARRVIAAIFEPLERVDELPRDRLMAENPNNPAQVRLPPAASRGAMFMRRGRFPENQNACPDVSN
jgi:hypothetical protein